jgi:hypothetical protein
MQNDKDRLEYIIKRIDELKAYQIGLFIDPEALVIHLEEILELYVEKNDIESKIANIQYGLLRIR